MMRSVSAWRSGSGAARGSLDKGFTLIEVVIALSIIALLSAVAVPAMARRLDAALRATDVAQIMASARLLPARVATLGVEFTLNEARQAHPLPDGRSALELPPGWSLQTGETPPRFGRGGICMEGELTVISPPPVQHVRIRFAEMSCAAQLIVSQPAT